jgi:hypothetical protein
MEPPQPARRLIALFGVGLMLAFALACFFAWRIWGMPVRVEEVASFLDKTMGAGKVKFSGVRVGVTRLENGDLKLAVFATARTLRPLYSKVDAAAYLRGAFKVDPESTAEARQFMADKDASQGPEYSRLRPFPPDPYRAVIVRMTAPAGTPYVYQAVLAARRDGDSWSLALESGAFDSGSPIGEARLAFGDNSFLAGDARDDARLHALVADLQAFAGRLAETQRNLEATHAAGVRIRREAFFARIAPGNVFQGVATRADEQQGTALYLEITGLSSGNGVKALLRNAGGWHYARAFQGSWSADDDFEAPTLALSSPTDQAVRNAGPFLENTQAWAFALRMDSNKGTLSEENRFYRYRFQFMDAGQAALLKASLAQEFDGAVSATAPGSLYNGTVVSKESASSEPILLRFAGRMADGEALQATIESTTRMWKRPLHGAIIGNSRRSGGRPVRLRSGSSEAVREAPADSVLGDRDGLEIRLGVENGSLVGDDERFTYRLAAAISGDLGTLDAARAGRAARFASVLRDGIAYDGVIRDDQGSATQARLEFAHIDRHSGAVSASIRSLVLLNVYQDFLGTWNPPDVSMELGSTGRGEFDFSDSLAVPFLVGPIAHTLQLALVGNALAGGIKGDTHWTMEFPVDAFLAAPLEGAEPDSPPAEGSVLPAFPRSPGAYLLGAGAWRPLPRNNGRVVVETIHPMTGEESSGGALGFLASGVRRLAQKGEKIPYLEFDGKVARPESGGSPVVLLFVGPAPARTPAIELAPVETLKDGRRGIAIIGGSPAAIQFGEQRVAAYVRQAGPGAVLLTTTSALPAGSYALNADVGYELAVR